MHRHTVFTASAAAWAGALTLLSAGAAGAGALQVSPVGFDLPAGTAASVLTVRNDDETPMNVQVRVFRWTQVNGEDHYEPADDVVASPPISTLAPHSDHLVRIVRTGAPLATEQSYRLVVDELPPPPGTEAHRVQLLLRHSIPLFFAAVGEAKANLVWSVKTGDKVYRLDGQNSGGRHIRLSNLKLLNAAGAPVATRDGLAGYVLAGAQIHWTLPAVGKAGGDPVVRLRADGDAGAIDVATTPAP